MLTSNPTVRFLGGLTPAELQATIHAMSPAARAALLFQVVAEVNTLTTVLIAECEESGHAV